MIVCLWTFLFLLKKGYNLILKLKEKRKRKKRKNNEYDFVVLNSSKGQFQEYSILDAMHVPTVPYSIPSDFDFYICLSHVRSK